MINRKDNPIEWDGLLFGLEEMKEHIQSLIDELSEKGEMSEEEYQVDIGHLYAHLNRAWNTRNETDEYVDKHFQQLSQFPEDISPVGQL